MNNKLIKIILSILVILINNIASAEVLTTFSIGSKTIKKLDNWIDADTVILIEIDETLIMPQSKMFSYDSNPYRLFIDDLTKMGKRSSGYNRAIARWYGQRQAKLVEDEWLKFMERAREKGAKIYGICSMPIQLTNIEEVRLAELEKLGIVFDESFAGSEGFVIERKGQWFSRFYKGLIFTGPYPKSKTILDLFKVSNIVPKKLITFGNIKHEVKSIDRSLRRFDMYFKSITYLATRRIKGQPDPDIVKFQQRSLIDQGKWYEDDVARQMLGK